MGSLAPASTDFPVSSSSSLLVDEWFISTNSDHILTHALTHELGSTRAPASSSSACSSSRPSLGPSESIVFLQSENSDVCKEIAEIPLHSCVSGMHNISMPDPSSAAQNHEHPQCKSHASTPSSSITSLFSSQAPSSALSSQASAGAGVAKVSKRRPRTNKRAPIAILSADTSNFRAMVQQLTGIPTSHAHSSFWGTPGVPLLKPQPTNPYNGGSLGLPTLDTSASFLGPKITPSTQNFPFFGTSQQSGHQPLSGSLPGRRPCNAAELAYFQEKSQSFLGNGYQPNMINYEALLSSSSSSSLPVLLDAYMDSAKLSGNLPSGSLKQLLAPNFTRKGNQSVTARQPSIPFENSQMFDDDDLHAKPSYNTVDSWLAFDGGASANHSPRIDLAKVVS